MSSSRHYQQARNYDPNGNKDSYHGILSASGQASYAASLSSQAGQSSSGNRLGGLVTSNPMHLAQFQIPQTPINQFIQPHSCPNQKIVWSAARKLPYRPRENAPLVKLTSNILQTYLRIGNRQKRRPAQQPTRTYNDGFDDQNYNYIIKPSEIWADRYRVVKLLGRGSFGQVVEAWDMHSRELVAIKIIKNRKAFYAQGLIEMQILEVLNHHDPNDNHNIVRLKGSFQHKNHLCLVYELLSFNLYDLLRNGNFTGLSVNLVRKLAIQIAQTLRYLSTTAISVIHCDLKPENVLLRNPRGCKLKVVDFGSSCFVDQKIYTYIQSRFYRSPEVILGHSYGTAIDMWSFGCMLVELHSGYPLFNGSSEHEQLCNMQSILGPIPEKMVKKSSPEKLSRFFSYVPTARGNGLSGEEFSLFRHVLIPCQKSDGSPSRLTLSDIVMKVRNPELREKRLSELLPHEKQEYALFIDFLQRILIYEPEKRMSPSDALRHPFLMIHRGTNTETVVSNTFPMVLRSRSIRRNTATSGQPAESLSKKDDVATLASPNFQRLRLSESSSSSNVSLQQQQQNPKKM